MKIQDFINNEDIQKKLVLFAIFFIIFTGSDLLVKEIVYRKLKLTRNIPVSIQKKVLENKLLNRLNPDQKKDHCLVSFWQSCCNGSPNHKAARSGDRPQREKDRLVT